MSQIDQGRLHRATGKRRPINSFETFRSLK
jgi:hypothetical protein